MKFLFIFIFATFVCSISCRRGKTLTKLIPGGIELTNLDEEFLTKDNLDHCGKKPSFTGCQQDFLADPDSKNQFYRCVNGFSICMKCSNGTVYQANGHCVFTDCSNDENKKCLNGQCVEKVLKDIIIRYCECTNGWEGFQCEEKTWINPNDDKKIKETIETNNFFV